MRSARLLSSFRPGRPAGQTWDIGAVVRERLRCAAKIMSEGDIEFVAWGPLSCPFGTTGRRRPWAVVQAGRSRICLGQTFWQAAGKADIEGMATTLLHECLHIFFDTIRHKAGEMGVQHRDLLRALRAPV